MKKKVITGSAVLAALMKDAEYAAQPEYVLKGLEPFVTALPDVLSDLLEKTVTLQSLCDAKILFLKHCIANDLVKKTMVVATTITGPDGSVKKVDNVEEVFGFFSTEDMAEMMQSALSMAIDMYASVAKDISSFLEENGVTEADVMASLGMSQKVTKKYQDGKLTIGDLLLVQPVLIVKNTK